MNAATLSVDVAPNARLVLDTCVLIAYLEGGQETSDAARLLIDDWVHTGRNRAIVSSVSAMELLVGPLKSQLSVEAYLDFLLRFPHIQCVPVDMAVAIQAAKLRAFHRMKPPDAMIVGTAIALDMDVIVTNDAGWPKTLPKPAIYLKDYATPHG